MLQPPFVFARLFARTPLAHMVGVGKGGALVRSSGGKHAAWRKAGQVYVEFDRGWALL
ncbi:hypothetical protein [Acetobacter syzygii]|uniref:hypothetical protein n=1 Tax=Acetobacter syzygii TaxID=146476 RepID=UPI0039ED6011